MTDDQEIKVQKSTSWTFIFKRIMYRLMVPDETGENEISKIRKTIGLGRGGKTGLFPHLETLTSLQNMPTVLKPSTGDMKPQST